MNRDVKPCAGDTSGANSDVALETGPDEAGPARRKFARPWGRAGWRSVMLLVDGLTDVISGEGREDQGLNGAGEQAKEHGWQGHH